MTTTLRDWHLQIIVVAREIAVDFLGGKQPKIKLLKWAKGLKKIAAAMERSAKAKGQW